MSVIAKKLNTDDVFNCKDLSKFSSTIVQVLPARGVSGSRFYMCEWSGLRFLTKVAFYQKQPLEVFTNIQSGLETDKTQKYLSPSDVEIAILEKLHQKITLAGVSPCILEMIYHKTCSGLIKAMGDSPDCEQYLGDVNVDQNLNKALCDYRGWVKAGLAHDKMAFLVLDRCDATFSEFLRREATISPVFLAVFRSLLFMVVYTFFAINVIYPKMRHRDLHAQNVMLKFDTSYKFRADAIKYLVFHVSERDGIKATKFVVPYFGIVVKIIDFGYSEIPEEGLVSIMHEDPGQNYLRIDNDLIIFYHAIHLLTTGSAKIEKILTKLDPTRSFIHYNSGFMREQSSKGINPPSYAEMLNASVWRDYKKTKIDKNQIYAEYNI